MSSLNVLNLSPESEFVRPGHLRPFVPGRECWLTSKEAPGEGYERDTGQTEISGQKQPVDSPVTMQLI